MTLIISKFNYKNRATKIKVHHPFGNGVIEKLRNIDGFSYSKTYSCWYIPATKKAYLQLKNYFPNCSLDSETQSASANRIYSNSIKSIKKDKIQNQEYVIISIDKTHKRFFVSHINNTQLWQALKKIENSFWIKDQKCWVFNADINTIGVVVVHTLAVTKNNNNQL